ncbi:hypothetical protein [Bradyrhizobium jicamae]|uniref:hypothetical protein n=1 Tax=Bradyrhizobium jicamae TaxID=280332 RepID=UPI0020134C6A|nr:hypothetical protein [Bradyrhizobium jicamae]
MVANLQRARVKTSGRLRLPGVVALVAITLLGLDPAWATRLISDDEAKLPPPKGAVVADRRGILRSPKIEVISPAQPTRSPVHLQLKFEAFGGARIDVDSVKITFLRTPNVDLTPRVKAYLQPSGVDMPDAEVPSGDFLVRVDLKDSDGRIGSTIFALKIAP